MAEGLHVCHDLISTAFILLWQLDRRKTKETLLKQWDKAAPPPPSTSSPTLLCFQIQWTNILFWALRAKRLLRICKSKLFSFPGAVMGAGGVVVADMLQSGPTAGACFHYLKALVCKEEREMWIEKITPQKTACITMQPILIHFLFLSLLFLSFYFYFPTL